jgi:hypothetical protein
MSIQTIAIISAVALLIAVCAGMMLLGSRIPETKDSDRSSDGPVGGE